MADDPNSDAKEDLPIRQHLVDTAVSFLQNPNVKQRPDDAKIGFLKKKGLTDSEITEALNRVKYGAAVSNEDQQLVNAYPLPPYRTPNAFWFHLRSYSSAFVSFAVAVYVLHRFYKTYIEPWLFGSKSEVSELSTLKQQLKELTNSVSQLTSTVASLEAAVNNQRHQMDRSSLYDVESIPKSVKNILDEVTNVKGLLLNRFSFPAPPAIAGATTETKTQNGDSKAPPKVVTIPKWQLRDSELGKSNVDPKEQVEASEETENSSSQSPSVENNSFIPVENQENNVKIAKDKQQDGDSIAVDEIPEAYLENNLSTKGNNVDEVDGAKIDVQDLVRDIEVKTLDDDSGVESHNYLSDSESADLTSRPNEHQECTKNSE